MSRAYVESLARLAHDHRAVDHPYLRALAVGDVPDLRWAITDFAHHYASYSRGFRSYLELVIARMFDADHRASLRANLAEESGRYELEELAMLCAAGIEPSWVEGVPHPDLFRRFCAAVGIDADASESPIGARWRRRFTALLMQPSRACAIGALGLGTEAIVSAVYAPLCEALARIPGLAARDTVFFPLHTLVDDDHGEILMRIAEDFARTPEGRRELSRGMLEALDLRAGVWDGLYARALGDRVLVRASA